MARVEIGFAGQMHVFSVLGNGFRVVVGRVVVGRDGLTVQFSFQVLDLMFQLLDTIRRLTLFFHCSFGFGVPGVPGVEGGRGWVLFSSFFYGHRGSEVSFHVGFFPFPGSCGLCRR